MRRASISEMSANLLAFTQRGRVIKRNKTEAMHDMIQLELPIKKI